MTSLTHWSLFLVGGGKVGQYYTAEELAKLAGIEGFTNLSIFKTSKEIEDALEQKDCGPALLWCAANQSRLSKVRESLCRPFLLSWSCVRTVCVSTD